MDLAQRAGINTGAVEFGGDGGRGIAVHLAARVAAAAGSGDVLVLSTTNALLLGSGIKSGTRGIHLLMGIEEAVELFAAGVNPANPLPVPGFKSHANHQ